MVGIPASRRQTGQEIISRPAASASTEERRPACFAKADRSSRSASADGSGSALLFFGGALGVAAVVLMSPGIFAASGPE